LDFFAVYLVPIDLWCIIPFKVAEGNLSLNLTPRKDINCRNIWKPGICCEARSRECGARVRVLRRKLFRNDVGAARGNIRGPGQNRVAGRPCLAAAKSNRVTSLLYFFTAARISF
jgi:hypothetical protein